MYLELNCLLWARGRLRPCTVFPFPICLPVAQSLVGLGIGSVRVVRVAVCTSPGLVGILTVCQNQDLLPIQLGVRMRREPCSRRCVLLQLLQSSCLKNPTVCWIDTGWVGLCIHPGLPAIGDVSSCYVLYQTMGLGPCAARGPLSKACNS